MKFKSILCGGVCLLAVVLAMASPPEQTRDAELDGVLVRFDEVQEAIRTLSAEFTETTSNPLLVEPLVARGRIYLTKPSAIRWEYSSPEEMRFVICDDQYTGYFPARGRAEKRDIKRWREQLFRFLGLGQPSADLSEFYEIRSEAPGAGMDDTVLLVLEPHKRRARKRVEDVRLWIDASTFLPRQVEYRGKNGSVRLIEFEEVLVNPELAANIYEVELPPDVEISVGFSALSGIGSGSSN